MFEDSLMESTRHVSKRRGWMTLLSTGIQIVLVAFLVILPLLRTSAISPVEKNRMPVVGPYFNDPASATHQSSGPSDPNRITTPMIHVSQSAGHFTFRTPDSGEQPPTVPTCFSDCAGGLNIPGGIGNSAPPVTLRPPEPQKPQVISHLDPGQIIRRVEPIYPPLARIARIQGTVVMHAIISRDGVIERLQIVRSDHPMLDRAALEAVSQWRFKPYILNREPIEVDTEITVNFALGDAR